MFVGSATPVFSADLYWDANGTSVGSGGTGTWNLTALTWSPNSDGVSGPYRAWNNTALDNTIFAGTAGTVTLGAAISVHNLTFTTNNYTLSGNTLTLAGSQPVITTNTGITSTISSVVAGTAGFTKDGAGTLVLTGTNSFTGNLLLVAGLLSVNTDAALGAAGNQVITSGGTTLIATGALNASRIINLSGGGVTALSGAGVGSAHYTGTGGITTGANVRLNNDTNDFTGSAVFAFNGSAYFTSVGDIGQASSLGAANTVATATIRFTGLNQYSDALYYEGTGSSSNRNWEFSTSGGSPATQLVNNGSGLLSLSGTMAANGSGMVFGAANADMELSGVISSVRGINFQLGAGRSITLGNSNTYSGGTIFSAGTAATLGTRTVNIGSLTNTGIASAFGTGTSSGITLTNGITINYTGAASNSNRNWTINGTTRESNIFNNGTGALNLSGSVSLAHTLTLGGSFAGENTLSGIISGTGALGSSGAGIWTLTGANTRTGAVVVDGGTLRAGSATSFGTVTGITVNSGLLDLNNFDILTPSLTGAGGEIALGTGIMTVNGTTTTSYAGKLTGTGGLIKAGTGTLALSGANTYTGDTTVQGGQLNLVFATSGTPVSDIISASSTLNMDVGTLKITGVNGAANIQNFNGLNIIQGSNRISAVSGNGGSVTVNFGAIHQTGGTIDFGLPVNGSFLTTSTTLGGWATVNGTDYAKVVSGVITAFTNNDYVKKDDAGTWQGGDIVSDQDGFFGTVNNTVQIGGLRYTVPKNSTVSVATGQILGVDGTIIVAPSVLSFNQVITGGSITGVAGGGALSILQNSTGNFTIASQIINNNGVTGFTKSGTGLLTLTSANTYTGATTVNGGVLAISSVANGGAASNIGASTADASNLIIGNGTLRYTGTTTVSDRGFTLVNAGVSRIIEVTSSIANLTFNGLVTSDDDAGFNKTGAGTLTLGNAANDYIGVTTVLGGTLAVSTLANGGMVSSIGKSGADAANLVLAGGKLQYTGSTVSTDRGFTLGTGGGKVGVTDAVAALTFSGAIVGTTGLTKEDAGTLILSANNAYTGGNIVNGGTLRAGSAQAFGSTANRMTVNSPGKVELAGFSVTVGGLTGTGTVDLSTGTLTSSGISAAFSGKITGSGGLTRTGSFTQTLTGCASDYTGRTTINGGTLSVDCLANGGAPSSIGASSDASANLTLSNGTFNYTGNSVKTDRGFTISGSPGIINVANSSTVLEFTGQVVGGGYLRKSGPGTLVLGGSNTYTNYTYVNEGILRLNSTSALGTPASVLLDNTSGVLLDLNGFNTNITYLTGGGTAGGDVALGSGDLTLTAGNPAADFAGKISGTGKFIKSGTGLQKLSGCQSTYTGVTSINGGILEVSCLKNGGVASSIGNSANAAGNLVINGGTLQYTGNGDTTDRQLTLGASSGNTIDASGSGTISFTSSSPVTFSAANSAQTLTLSGLNKGYNKFELQLGNNGTGVTSLAKTGTGTWILTNSASTYTGITSITGGILGVDKLADGGVASSLGASSSAASNLVIGNGSTLRYTGSGDSTNRLFTLAAGTTFLESSGSGAIVFTDTGPVTLQGNNQARTIALGGSNLGNNTLAGAIGDSGTGKTVLAKNDDGTWILAGNNTYSGNTVINGGMLQIGNGGTTGSIVSDLFNNSILSFNRQDTYSYGGLISGAGEIRQTGSGTTVLTGTNIYTGTTTVEAGTLLINGNQSAAAGITTVTANGKLGGSGIIGGDVNVTGGTLSAGGDDVGKLTINGNLKLDSASSIHMKFGQSNAVGGMLNDLIEVNGDVVLDGTLNVSVATGGSFEVGMYRVLNFSGRLNGNGLLVGNMAGGSSSGAFVQTSVSGQVNLIYTNGLVLNYWDGNAGPKFNGIVDGGSGTWQNSSGNNNWTEISGGVNSIYSDGSYAIFSNVAGIVKVDNMLGAVTASGMQFAADGYRVEGDSLALAGAEATIRVGDGTGAGSGFTATITSVLTGTSKLTKTDAGTLILTGTNSYSGGTEIRAGTLRIAQDSNLGAAGGLTLNGGTLNTTANIVSDRDITLTGAGTFNQDANTSLTLSGGSATGTGALTKDGDGALILTGDAAHSGGTTITAGVFQIGTGGTSGSIAGDIVNNASLVFNRSDDITYANVVSGSGSLRQSGAGTTTLIGVNTYSGATAVDAGRLVVQSGGKVTATSHFNIAETSATQAGMVIDGSTAAVTSTGAATSLVGGAGEGTLTVQNGGKLTSGGTGNVQVGSAATGKGTVNVNGAGSQWDIANTLDVLRGSFTLFNGGVATSGSATFAGGDENNADLLITGAGSRFETIGGFALANHATASGTVTLAVSGTLKVGGGTFTMGAGNAVLNIGGVEGSADVSAGTLDAASLQLGAATNRLNFNHNDTQYSFSTAVSGAGSVHHNGSGGTILTGTSSYTGATTVTAGSLYINGDQSAAKGQTSVESGAKLGGKGTIGGNVTIADGGALNPGDVGQAPGELTIGGNLELAANAVMNYRFGKSGMIGGPLNDLVTVKGDLTLAGLLNVQTSAGGSFDPGVYRVISYDGAFVDNELTVGTIPSPDFYLQTSVPGQVNLINTSGFTLNYWDGALAAHKNNSQADGGDGIWQNAAGIDNWTIDTGALNAPYSDNAFAIFTGTLGIVTTDSSQGDIKASGMQFLTTGYVIQGDTINLTGGAKSVIRTGDGTAAGAAITVTIKSELTGSTQLVKSDLGTLILAAANTYTGGTAINGGTLQVSADNNLGVTAGDVTFDGGTLATTTTMITSRNLIFNGIGGALQSAGNTTLTIDGTVTGTGALHKAGAGTLLVLSDTAHTGGTLIDNGTLQLGNRGTTGRVSGAIINDGLLIANRSDGLRLDNVISGSGAFEQAGTGSTILAGINSYKGSTAVKSGVLFINGDQSAATGDTNVLSGATLSGAGTIGGNVIVANGAVLEPGSAAGAASTLHINGDLRLANNSVLNMQFGEANVAGGAYNDLINVGGDLTLGGTLNVSVSTNGVFGFGLYRIINFSGHLTDNGLALGQAPLNYRLSIQTSVAGQINLVSDDPANMNYWDGDGGEKGDHTITGGDGIWQNNLGNDNWTTFSGDKNGAYTNGSYAIFTGKAGTVTVDDSLGQIETSGMQFAISGYQLKGDSLKLTGSQAIISVGDGSYGGAVIHATIANALSGASQLVKSDLGTLILSGNNTYTGGTAINGGTVQIDTDQSLGDVAGSISFNNGTLYTTQDLQSSRSIAIENSGILRTAANTNLTLDGIISGTGNLTKTGTGTLIMTADNSAYNAHTQIEAGALHMKGVLGGTVSVSTQSWLQGTGKVGSTMNSGTIAPGSDDIGTLTIQGDYVSNNGTLQISAVLGDDTSTTSLLTITGATSGATQLNVINRGGMGAQTVQGIKIIDVKGISNGTFALNGDYVFNGEQAIVAGAYGYRLYKNGLNTPDDGDWYLRSALLETQPEQALYQPGVPLYESYAGLLQEFNKLSTLQQRVGNRQWAERTDKSRSDTKDNRSIDSNGVWARIEAAHSNRDPAISTSGATYDANVWKLQTGIDGLLVENETGSLTGSVFAQYGTIKSNVHSLYGSGTINTSGYGIGTALTWYSDNGFYADAQVQLTGYDSDIHSSKAGRDLVSGNNAYGTSLSIEAGKRIAISENWSLTPQAQLAFSAVRFGSFKDIYGADVSLDKSRSLTGRLGLAANHNIQWQDSEGRNNRTHFYALANVYYEFAGDSEITVSETGFVSRNERLNTSISAGGSFNWADDKYSIYGEARFATGINSIGKNNEVGGTVGLRTRW
ncbi:autotransporter-associated beta strand repeat-containing protein [Pseudochrobactrum kiredjianiae]|uniref:Autotransporter-associated beta strand repeat-containing protein n=1 Tax=Pseudochrobactrum kiredjianiae TaxID=386305 RepID=A0ABW3V2K2_9HYPH|nr:autotransporter-associated beta strand repeat-containing protein [Pseudochrobactrum kiredjianiae]MDM7852273.1 autotransporter outer membrane beta-barrel domain-containing protein [Pseudochrobactrum kiredjianiae]